MIKVTIYKNHQGEYIGFESLGHAGYAKRGKDIVCAAVSALVMNAVNSIKSLTSDKTKVRMRKTDGLISLQFESPASHDASLLMKSLVLGLKAVQKSYGKKFISIICKEV